jgi:hypothetical protein
VDLLKLQLLRIAGSVCDVPIHVLTLRRLPYKVEKIDISKNTQKEDWVSTPSTILFSSAQSMSAACSTRLIRHPLFSSLSTILNSISSSLPSNSTQFLAINPNGRIPALTDAFTDGQKINLFESGSIMQYLVDRYDTEYKISFPKGTREYYEMNNWLVSIRYNSFEAVLTS